MNTQEEKVMKTFHVLGKSNASLSLILDTLYTLHGEKFKVVVVSNIPQENNTSVSLPYCIGNIEVVEVFYKDWTPIFSNLLLGFFRTEIKQKVYQFFYDHFQITTKQYESIIHPASSLAHTVAVGHGANIGPNVVIAPYANIGNLASVNRQASIGHHTTIGDFSTLNPGCNIAGKCTIGKGVTIGMGANIVDGIEIGDNTTIGAGTLVTKSIPANVTAYGVPARIIRKNSSTNVNEKAM
jgi:sugar O-acyltransferase (sialic acid O-acetyltransferase NeuD family)